MMIPSLSWVIFAALIGAVLGSVVSMLIWRIPLIIQRADLSIDFNLFWPPSHCEHCQHRLKWYDNVPLVSWLLLCGRCRHCTQSIGKLTLFTEVILSLWAGGLALFFQPSADWFFLLVFMAILLTLVVIDFRHRLLPDSLTYTLLWSGLLWHCYSYPDGVISAVIGVVAGYLILWIIYQAGLLICKRRVIGGGDLKFLAALGACLGWQSLPLLLLLASSTTVLVVVSIMFLKKEYVISEIPFGPGLALSGLIIMYYLHISPYLSFI